MTTHLLDIVRASADRPTAYLFAAWLYIVGANLHGTDWQDEETN